MSDAPILLAPGIHRLSAADYHADRSWGSSSLKAMRKGPAARVLWQRDHPTDSDARHIGSAVHCAVLEPERFTETYAHKPDGMSFATKDGKAWRDEFTGRRFTILTHDEWMQVDAIASAVRAKPAVAHALSHAVAFEPSLFWQDALTGEPCKGRPDFYTDDPYGDGILYDLKVSRYAGPEMAYRAFVEGWMHQLAHYRTGFARLGLGDFYARLIVVPPVPPYYVWTCEVKPDALDLLAIENNQTIYALGKHRAANVWPDSPDAWVKIEPPPSALIATTVLDSVEEID